MSALDTLRKRAEKAAGALRDAQQATEAEAAAIRTRNADRKATFWSNAGERCRAAQETANEALAQVRRLIGAGQVAAALDAYAVYRNAFRAWQKLTYSAQAATTHYVHRDSGESCEPDTYGATLRYASGVPGNMSVNREPTTWAALLEQALQDAAEHHGSQYVTTALQPLRDSLEQEPER